MERLLRHLLEDRWVLERAAEKDIHDLTSRLGHPLDDRLTFALDGDLARKCLTDAPTTYRRATPVALVSVP